MQTITAQQILVPKKVYIGDAAELRCTFNNPDANLKELVKNGTTEISESVELFSNDFDIKSITISQTGVDFYQLTINFIPWKTGELQFEPLAIPETELLLEFQPIQIVSLISTEGANATTLRDSAAPLLIPGTAYKLYGSLSGFIIFLIILIRIIVKRKSIIFYLNNKKLLRKYKKNKKQALRQLRQIAENHKLSDLAAAENIQRILRNYLEVRYDYPFTKAAASEIAKGWLEVTGGILSDEKTDALNDISAAFIRTDYIRYSKNGTFNPEEKNELIEQISNRIEILEKEEKPEGENNA
ncbi:MAG: hypothetical protein J6X84_05035 [Treponema sp.]|nr:hypothetical protein [Treponema sp.]